MKSLDKLGKLLRGRKILSPPQFQHCGGERPRCPRVSDAYGGTGGSSFSFEQAHLVGYTVLEMACCLVKAELSSLDIAANRFSARFIRQCTQFGTTLLLLLLLDASATTTAFK